VTITETPPSEPGKPNTSRKVKSRECDLDTMGDTFWRSHKGLPFPSVAENIQAELEDYRSKEETIKEMKHEMGLDGNGSGEEAATAAMGNMILDNTQVMDFYKLLIN